MKTYVVVKGDTMWDIARRHGVQLNELLALNPQINNASLIFPGQVINVPANGNSTYTIMLGDTMWGIASKYGVQLNELLAVNPHINNPALIFPGQTINIPKETGAPEEPTTPSEPEVPSEPEAPSDIRELEDEVIRLVNAERQMVGQPPLTANSELTRIARIKSQDFINNNYLSHNSPVYGSPFEMLRSFGVDFTAAAENIASGQRTAASAMNSWMNSPGHRANILSSTYNEIGVGVARGNDDNLYWTQLFIRS